MEHTTRTERQLGAVLRRERTAAGLTQAQLSARTGLRQATISKLEDGAPATQLRTLMQALAALDLELVVRPRRKGGDDIEALF